MLRAWVCAVPTMAWTLNWPLELIQVVPPGKVHAAAKEYTYRITSRSKATHVTSQLRVISAAPSSKQSLPGRARELT